MQQANAAAKAEESKLIGSQIDLKKLEQDLEQQADEGTPASENETNA